MNAKQEPPTERYAVRALCLTHNVVPLKLPTSLSRTTFHHTQKLLGGRFFFFPCIAVDLKILASQKESLFVCCVRRKKERKTKQTKIKIKATCNPHRRILKKLFHRWFVFWICRVRSSRTEFPPARCVCLCNAPAYRSTGTV